MGESGREFGQISPDLPDLGACDMSESPFKFAPASPGATPNEVRPASIVQELQEEPGAALEQDCHQWEALSSDAVDASISEERHRAAVGNSSAPASGQAYLTPQTAVRVVACGGPNRRDGFGCRERQANASHRAFRAGGLAHMRRLPRGTAGDHAASRVVPALSAGLSCSASARRGAGGGTVVHSRGAAHQVADSRVVRRRDAADRAAGAASEKRQEERGKSAEKSGKTDVIIEHLAQKFQDWDEWPHNGGHSEEEEE